MSYIIIKNGEERVVEDKNALTAMIAEAIGTFKNGHVPIVLSEWITSVIGELPEGFSYTYPNGEFSVFKGKVCPCLTNSQRYEIFKEVNRNFHIADAKAQFEPYWKELEEAGLGNCVPDYNLLAETFERRKDCDIDDNSQWQYIIEEYIKNLNFQA